MSNSNPDDEHETTADANTADSDAAADSAKENSDEPELATPESDDAKSNGAKSDEVKSGTEPKASENADDGEAESDLPEEEPLTPELVEDEAIRGDFMLRCAVVLLAFLLGCMQIAETETLVHVKSGEHLVANGIWPSGADPFSYTTTTDQSWVNLSWLFDIVVAGVFNWLGGSIGLVLVKALLAAVMFWFVLKTANPSVSTWWGSIAATGAVMACAFQFTARPEIVTLFGLALTLRFLNNWHNNGHFKRLLWLAPIFLLWSNLDNRIYLGLALLVLYAIGQSIATKLEQSRTCQTAELKHLWIAVGCCFVGALLNPFHVHSLLAPIDLYGIQYPVLQSHYTGLTLERIGNFPITAEQFSLTGPSIAALSVLVAAIVAMVLNLKNFDLGHVLVFLGFVGFSIVASRDLAPAALVACVIGSLHAQSWYLNHFRQDYTTDAKELLFSRGGRAMTVLCLFAFAFLGITGKLTGITNKRIGVGFADGLQAEIDGYREQLAESLDDRPFNFRLDQGDILIWIDQKVFVDSRVVLYASGEDNLLELHQRTRYSLLPPSATVTVDNSSTPSHKWRGDSAIWKSTFDRFNVTHVLSRLSGRVPAYPTYEALLNSRQWTLTNLGAVTAVFYRADQFTTAQPALGSLIAALAISNCGSAGNGIISGSTTFGYAGGSPNPELLEYVTSHRYDALRAGFKTESKLEELKRPFWPQKPTSYRTYLMPHSYVVSNPVQLAHHYWRRLQQAEQDPNIPMSNELGIALCYLAIRNANKGLAEYPDNPDAFRILGDAYLILGRLESGIVQRHGVSFPDRTRYYEAIGAFSQALILDPDHTYSLLKLYQIYSTANKEDLALDCIERFDELTKGRESQLTRFEIDAKKHFLERKPTLIETRDEIKKYVEAAFEQQTDRLRIVGELYTAGFVLQALDVLEADRVYLKQTPAAQRMHATVLMESGRTEEAMVIFSGFKALAAQYQGLSWETAAGWASLSSADYSGAITLWSDEIHTRELGDLEGLLQTLPMAQLPPQLVRRDAWPIQQTLAVMQHLYKTPNEVAQLRWFIAIAHMEAGHLKLARKEFETILDESPDSAVRVLAVFYLTQLVEWPELKEEHREVLPPSSLIPIWSGIFTDEPDDK